MSKKEISVEVSQISLYEMESDIDSVIKYLVNTKETYSKLEGITKIHLVKSCHPYSDTEYLSVQGYRIETDNEYMKRMNEEKEYKERQETRDAAEFARLQKKFKGK